MRKMLQQAPWQSNEFGNMICIQILDPYPHKVQQCNSIECMSADTLDDKLHIYEKWGKTNLIFRNFAATPARDFILKKSCEEYLF